MKQVTFNCLEPLDVFTFAPYTCEPKFVFLRLSADQSTVHFKGLNTGDSYDIPFIPTQKIYCHL